MAPLLWWGLPSSQHDTLLFAGEAPWPAERYAVAEELARLRERNAGADIDLNPITNRAAIVDLTATPGDRAEILRRYRLYSRQPDEMIIFRALQRMDPRALDFDPQLYQYGGGYIYLIGAIVGTAGALGLIELTHDAGVYLERPETFAGVYVAARFVSLVFGALALLAVHKLARRAAGRTAGWIAMACVAASPVFITAVLEAKPHLPSACMILWATLSALDYCARQRVGNAVRMGLQAGYGFGLVLTGIAGGLLWPALIAVRPRRQGRLTGALATAAVLAVCVWLMTNPYIPYNLLFKPGALSSNIANSTAMYAGQVQRAGQGAVRVGTLLMESMGPGVLVAGLIGLVMLLRRHRETWIVAVPGLAMLLIAGLIGAGKPAEFARFLILPAMLLAVATGCVLAALARRRLITGLVATLVVLVLTRGSAYVGAYERELLGTGDTRDVAARYLMERAGPDVSLGVIQEPAPFSIPPLDFVRRTILLLPDEPPANLDPYKLPDYLVFTADDDVVHQGAWWQAYYDIEVAFPRPWRNPTRITWANKPVFVYSR